MLYGIAFRILRDQAAAEDACQYAFVAACGQAEDAVNAQKAVAWLISVVVNESLRQRRRRQVEARGLPRAAERESGPSQADCDPWLREHIWACVHELPEMTRTVVVLRVAQGLSGNEVKDLLGVSAAQVSRQLHRGMEALRVRLAEYAPTAR